MNQGLSQAIAAVSLHALGANVKCATKFLSGSLIVRATRPSKFDRRSRGDTVVLTVGKPNYRERKFIKACHKAGEPLPVKKIQIKVWSKERKHG